ncbi:MAG: GIY-YIG nuclease family protein [Patescibacteria group bacterium]
MYYVYILKSLKDGKLYTGFTEDLQKRLERHKLGLVISTKNRRPFKLIYYEACLNKRDALHREIYLKSAWGKRYVKNRISDYLKKEKSQ